MQSSKNIESTRHQLLTVSEVADWLNVSRSLVYQLVEAKQIAACRIGNGRGAIRFRTEDIDAFVEASVDRKEAIRVPISTKTQLKHIRVKKR